jgi:hypothetical protein
MHVTLGSWNMKHTPAQRTSHLILQQSQAIGAAPASWYMIHTSHGETQWWWQWHHSGQCRRQSDTVKREREREWEKERERLEKEREPERERRGGRRASV